MEKTPLELAQEAVQSAKTQVDMAQKEYIELKDNLTLCWFEEKSTLDEGKNYLKTGEWKISAQKHHLIKFLSEKQNLLAKEQNLALEKQNLALEKQNLALEKQRRERLEIELEAQTSTILLIIRILTSSCSKVFSRLLKRSQYK